MAFRTLFLAIAVLLLALVGTASARRPQAAELITTSFSAQLRRGQPAIARVSITSTRRIVLVLEQFDPLNPYFGREIVWTGSRGISRSSFRTLLLDLRVLANAEIATTPGGIVCQSIDPFPSLDHLSVVRDYDEAADAFNGPITEIHTEGFCQGSTTNPAHILDRQRLERLRGKISTLVSQLFRSKVRVVSISDRRILHSSDSE